VCEKVVVGRLWPADADLEVNVVEIGPIGPVGRRVP
jgi:hypothetical protein